jgi:hypothetical protein
VAAAPVFDECATAGAAASSSNGTLAGSAGSASGDTGYSSARSPSTVRLVARIVTPGQRAQQLVEVVAVHDK